MAATNMILDSRLRSLVVLVPALIVVVWIASEVASEEFIWPLLVMIAFVTLVIFTVFVRSIRFEDALLNILIVGYLVGNRGFADITVAKPFYPGEVCLAAIILSVVARYILTQEKPDFSGTLSRLILIFCGLGVVRLALDYGTYRMDALHDSAAVYYSLYFIFGRQMLRHAGTSAVLEKCLKFAVCGLVPIALAQRFAPDLLLNNGYMTVLYQKDDLLTTFAGVMVLILYTRPAMFRWRWIRPLLIVFYIAFVFNGITRASLVGLMAGSVLLFAAGKRNFLLYPIVAVGLGVTVLAGFSVAKGDSNTTEISAVVDKLYSIVDISGNHVYSTDVGQLKSDTNEYRRTLWSTFVDETTQKSPIFGRGFGFDFIAIFESGSLLPDEIRLRSAHNFYVTMYGRMGLIGLLVVALITWQVIVNGFRAARAVREGWLSLADLGFWCSAWAILTSAALGVVLEGPVGAIVFWSFLGIGTGCMEKALATHRRSLAEAEEAEASVPLPLPAHGARGGYGMPARLSR